MVIGSRCPVPVDFYKFWATCLWNSPEDKTMRFGACDKTCFCFCFFAYWLRNTFHMTFMPMGLLERFECDTHAHGLLKCRLGSGCEKPQNSWKVALAFVDAGLPLAATAIEFWKLSWGRSQNAGGTAFTPRKVRVESWRPRRCVQLTAPPAPKRKPRPVALAAPAIEEHAADVLVPIPDALEGDEGRDGGDEYVGPAADLLDAVLAVDDLVGVEEGHEGDNAAPLPPLYGEGSDNERSDGSEEDTIPPPPPPDPAGPAGPHGGNWHRWQIPGFGQIVFDPYSKSFGAWGLCINYVLLVLATHIF